MSQEIYKNKSCPTEYETERRKIEKWEREREEVANERRRKKMCCHFFTISDMTQMSVINIVGIIFLVHC